LEDEKGSPLRSFLLFPRRTIVGEVTIRPGGDKAAGVSAVKVAASFELAEDSTSVVAAVGD